MWKSQSSGCSREVFQAFGISRRWFLSNSYDLNIAQTSKELWVKLREKENCVLWICGKWVGCSLHYNTRFLPQKQDSFYLGPYEGRGDLSFVGNTFRDKMKMSRIRMRKREWILFYHWIGVALFYFPCRLYILKMYLALSGYWSTWLLVARSCLIDQCDKSSVMDKSSKGWKQNLKFSNRKWQKTRLKTPASLTMTFFPNTVLKKINIFEINIPKLGPWLLNNYEDDQWDL